MLLTSPSCWWCSWAAPYLTLNPAVYFAEQRAVYVAHTAGITTHVAGAAMLAAL